LRGSLQRAAEGFPNDCQTKLGAASQTFLVAQTRPLRNSIGVFITFNLPRSKLGNYAHISYQCEERFAQDHVNLARSFGIF
jgi:hypothetical protein